MRIAFIGGFAFSPKGTIRARAHPLASELVRLGHEVTIFLTPYDNVNDFGRDWEQEGVRIQNMKGFVSTASRAEHGDWSNRWKLYPRLLKQLISSVNHYQPDAIHIFKPKGFAGAAATYLYLRGARSIVLDCDDWEGWGGWNDVKPYPWVVKAYIDRQERWLTRSAPAITAASRVLEQRAQRLRAGTDAVYYVPNCGASNGNAAAQARARSLPQSKLRAKLGLPAGPIVLYSGHFDGSEDMALFCRAVSPVAARHRAAIVFVGDGPQLPNLRELFSQQAQVNSFFFPQLPYEDFCQVVASSDISAFPYRDDTVHRAKCSARMVDYMAMGNAVLSSAVGQNCEYITDGESGILARPGDENDFSEKLDLLLRDSTLRVRLGQNAQRRIREHFSWSGEPLQQCLAAYERVSQRQ